MVRLLVVLAISVMAFGLFAYFCPSIQQEVINGHPTSQAFGGWTWREIGGRNAGLYFNESMNIEGYPYRIQGEVLMIGGFALLVGIMIYPPVKARLHHPEPEQISEKQA